MAFKSGRFNSGPADDANLLDLPPIFSKPKTGLTNSGVSGTFTPSD
jgi:hypothetical protein